jgi:hypothetical protein
MNLLITNTRVLFPAFFVPKEVKNNGNPRYSGYFLLPKNDPQVTGIKKAMLETAKATGKWGEDPSKVVAGLVAEKRTFFSDGDVKADTNSDKPAFQEYAGNFIISASTYPDKPPRVLNFDRSPITAAHNLINPGCIVNVLINIWAQDKIEHGRRINAQMLAVQYVSKGTSPIGFDGDVDVTVFPVGQAPQPVDMDVPF